MMLGAKGLLTPDTYVGGIGNILNRIKSCMGGALHKTCGYAPGSYTVEAALVMPVIIGVFAALLYMIFFLHDQYIIRIYADRMAQECCWKYLENENYLVSASASEITSSVKSKYEKDLTAQMLVTDITISLGTCKKNLFTHVYTGTWRIVGKPQILVSTMPYYTFGTISYEGKYQRVYARKWIYGRDLLKSGSE